MVNHFPEKRWQFFIIFSFSYHDHEVPHSLVRCNIIGNDDFTRADILDDLMIIGSFALIFQDIIANEKSIHALEFPCQRAGGNSSM